MASQGKASLAVLVNGERPIIDLRVDTETADIDSYVPNGFAALSSDGRASWSRLIENFVNRAGQEGFAPHIPGRNAQAEWG